MTGFRQRPFNSSIAGYWLRAKHHLTLNHFPSGVARPTSDRALLYTQFCCEWLIYFAAICSHPAEQLVFLWFRRSPRLLRPSRNSRFLLQ